MKHMFSFYFSIKTTITNIYICVAGLMLTKAYCKYAFVLHGEHQNPDVQIYPFSKSSFVNIGLASLLIPPSFGLSQDPLPYQTSKLWASSCKNTPITINESSTPAICDCYNQDLIQSTHYRITWRALIRPPALSLHFNQNIFTVPHLPMVW